MHTLWKDLLFLHGHVAHPSVLDPPAPERALATLLPRALGEARATEAQEDAALSPPLAWRECA